MVNLSHVDIATLKSMSVMGGLYILDELKLRTTANGKPFVSGKLSDASGSIDFVMWDDCPLSAEDSGKVIYVDALVSTYKGALQAKLSSVRLATGEELRVLDMAVLIPVAPINIDNAFWTIKVFSLDAYDTPYGKVALALVKEYEKELRICPAGKSVHHAFVGGWAMHIRNMLKMAKSICDQYGDIYPIDRSLLYAGVVLHDIGKLREFTLNDFGLVKQYSDEGKLLGHAALGMLMVAEKAKELDIPQEEMLPLQHLILSHHGKAELGAAVEPMCIEAQLLSQLDGIDSRLEICRCALDKTEKGQFSDLIRALNKKVYRVA